MILDPPRCTCLKGALGGFVVLTVLDPYCQIRSHKEAADYGIEPKYDTRP